MDVVSAGGGEEGEARRIRFESRKSTAASRSDGARWWDVVVRGGVSEDEDEGEDSMVSTMALMKFRVKVSYVGRKRLSFLPLASRG